MLDLAKERMLCLVVPEDKISIKAVGELIPGWLRGFIMQNRETGAIHAFWRMKRQDGSRNWYELEPKPETKNSAEYIRKGLVDVFQILCSITDPTAEVACFYPPDGNSTEQLAWLVKMDLIEVTKIELADNNGVDKMKGGENESN